MAKKPTYEELEKRIQELRESQTRFQLLFERAPLGYQSLNEDGNFIDVNSAWLDIFEYSREEVIGKPFSDFLHTDWKDHFREYFPSFKSIGEILGVEFEMVKKDGSFILVSFNGKIGKDKYGGFRQTHCIVQDITERRRMEEKIRESEERLKDFINSATDSFVFFDSELNIIQVSKAHMKMFHPEMDQEDLIGKNLLEIVPNLRETGRFNDFMKVMETGTPFYSDDIVPHQKFGNRYLSVKAFKMAGGLGTITVDVTRRKQAESALNKAKEELEEKVKQRTVELAERNAALKVLLDQRKNDQKKMEKTIMSNIKRLIKPNLTRLKKSALNGRQKSELAILEANLNEIVSPFESSLSSEYLKLTPTEIQVANFIKHNATSKEIAESLGLSRRTIDTHRHNIRKKIGIREKGINLKTYLSSLT